MFRDNCNTAIKMRHETISDNHLRISSLRHKLEAEVKIKQHPILVCFCFISLLMTAIQSIEDWEGSGLKWEHSGGPSQLKRNSIIGLVFPCYPLLTVRVVKETRMNAAEMWMKYNVHSIFVPEDYMWRGIGFINNPPRSLWEGECSLEPAGHCEGR